MTRFAVHMRRVCLAASVATLVLASGALSARSSPAETEERTRIAAANLEDAIVVDCQLPGKLRKLGGTRTYLTPGALVRLSAVDCRARGGEYTIGDLSSGTLSIQRWTPLAQNGNAEAQYYVARIHANGMGGVPVDYAAAAQWYQRAADQNYSPAIAELGFLYEHGLGVSKDPMLALNLQRKAAGLGDELDYAWKITAAKEEAAREIGALSAQLNATNTDLESLRGQLQSTTDAAFQSRAALTRSESAVLDLREQLAAAKASATGGADLGELQRALAARESELIAAHEQVQSLNDRLHEQQAALSTRMAESQGASRNLNELLATEQARTQALEARVAQADQRLLRSQQELAEQRTQYRAEVERLVAERADIERAVAKSKDEATALLQARERELARQQMRVAALEKALAEKMKEERAAAATASAQSSEKSKALQASVKNLQAQVEAQQRELKARTAEIGTLRERAAQDRDAVVRDMQQQLAQRTSELEDKKRRLTALTTETGSLRGEVARLQEQRDREIGGAEGEAARARASLRMAQQKLSEQRERLDQMQVEKAAEMAALVKARDELQRQLAANRRTSEAQVAFLSKDLDARRKDLEARDGEIARLQARLEDQTQRYNEMLAQGPSTGGASGLTASTATPGSSTAGGVVKMRSADARNTQPSLRETHGLTPGSYHALIIGNSLYHYMQALDTPANDAKAVADVLKTRYGFKVKLLLDATREQIMTSLHQATLDLGPQDSLLIYYAGHGDLAGPNSRAFWLGVEADPDTRTGWLEADHIRAKIKEMRAKHVVLVADSCFSGAITHPKTTTIGRGLNETRLRVQWNRRARMVLTSGEVTPVADSEGGGEHSVFARHFIQTLRQNDGIMSGEMLSHELRERMLAQPVKVTERGQRQTPTYSTLQDANHDVGDFFFVPTQSEVRVASLDY
jgi:hypothetical protein